MSKKKLHFYRKGKVLYTLLMITCFFSSAFSQSLSVSGIVSDAEGPIPGVSVKVKGTNTGVATDVDGKYSIKTTKGAVLVFSSVGYAEQQVTVSDNTTINVTMTTSSQELDQVVVVGYGTQLKKDLTGAVSSISPKDFNTGIAMAPEQLMQGKVAGVNIVQNSGAPGAGSTVSIRGASSISAGNDPLYVVDGVPLQFGSSNLFVPSSGSVGNSSAFSSEKSNPLNVINPADIESIDILKDASATAIYGSRGANGVIVITTKSKNRGGESFSYDTYFGTSSIRKTLPVLSAEEFRNYAKSNNLAYSELNANTNWQDAIFSRAFSQNHNISFGGSGLKGASYRTSLGYSSQEGIIASSGIEKFTGRFNANQNALNDRLKLGLNLTYAKVLEDNTPISSNINNEGGNILKDAIRWAPTLPVRNADGSYYQVGELRVNPVSWGDQVDDESNTGLLLGNVDVSFDILKSLTFKTTLGYTDESIQRFTNVPATHPAAETEKGRASINKMNNNSTLFEMSLNFNKDISAKSNLSLLAGYSFQRFVNQYTFTAANKFVSSAVKWNLMQSGSLISNTSFKDANRLVSAFGRANYKLMDRYLFTFTLRNDASSRFGKNNQWGLFPSGAFAWRISDEPFFKVSSVSNLKLRTGYGITGNQEIPNNLFREQLGIAGSAVYVLGGVAVPSVLPTNYANPDLKWEETSQLNLGLDFGLFAERLTGSIDYYEKRTDDLLLQFSTAAPSVVSTQWANVGEVQNKGIELALSGEILRNDNFEWSANLNYSRNRNKVISLSNDQFSRAEIRTSPTSGVIGGGASTQIIKPGLPLGTFFGRQFTGYDASGKETYLDIDGVAGADEVVIGNAQPDYIFGLTNNVRWKRFDAALTFRGVVGNDVLNNTGAEFSYKSSAPGINVLQSALTSPASRTQTAQFSSQWIEDASYLRLDNMTIGYTLQPGKVRFLSRARVYLTGQNLFVVTKYTGFDPEVRTNTNQGGIAPIGIDYLSYPRPRTFLIGANLGF